MRQTIKEIETNMANRWFLGLGFYTEVPDFSAFGKNYARRFHDSDVFEEIFYHILREITDKGLLSADYVFIDSTLLRLVPILKKYTQNAKKRLNGSLPMPKRSIAYDGQLYEV